MQLFHWQITTLLHTLSSLVPFMRAHNWILALVLPYYLYCCENQSNKKTVQSSLKSFPLWLTMQYVHCTTWDSIFTTYLFASLLCHFSSCILNIAFKKSFLYFYSRKNRIRIFFIKVNFYVFIFNPGWGKQILVPNLDGMTPIEIAERAGFSDLASILRYCQEQDIYLIQQLYSGIVSSGIST